MKSVTFHSTVDDEQVIRPPANVQLPLGPLEVTVRTLPPSATPDSLARANENLSACRVSTGRPTGIDNAAIDANLARVYGNEVHPSS